MDKEIVPYFGGTWAAVGQPADDRRLRTVMLFFGTMYLVFVSLIRPKHIETSMHHYALDADEMSMQHLGGDEGENMPIVEVKWRFVDGRFLEFVQEGEKTLWEATKVERLVEEGYPMQLFESLRNHFIDIGSFYLTEALVPDRSIFEAIDRRAQKKGK